MDNYQKLPSTMSFFLIYILKLSWLFGFSVQVCGGVDDQENAQRLKLRHESSSLHFIIVFEVLKLVQDC